MYDDMTHVKRERFPLIGGMYRVQTNEEKNVYVASIGVETTSSAIIRSRLEKKRNNSKICSFFSDEARISRSGC